MKIKNDFITNSSSTSFVCEITGEIFEVETGDYDIYVECENGHKFDRDYFESLNYDFFEMTNKEIDKIIKTELSMWTQRDFFEEGYDSKDEFLGFKNKMGKMKFITNVLSPKFENPTRELKETECPICKMKYISIFDREKYIYKKFNISDNEIDKEILSKFKNYKDFKEFLNKE